MLQVGHRVLAGRSSAQPAIAPAPLRSEYADVGLVTGSRGEYQIDVGELAAFIAAA